MQVTYIGYQNTTGMAAMDYRLTDDWADPPGTTDAFYTEKLVRLPRSFFCYQPSADAPPVAPLPATGTRLRDVRFVQCLCQNHAASAGRLGHAAGIRADSRLVVLGNAAPSLIDDLTRTVTNAESRASG